MSDPRIREVEAKEVGIETDESKIETARFEESQSLKLESSEKSSPTLKEARSEIASPKKLSRKQRKKQEREEKKQLLFSMRDSIVQEAKERVY